MSKSKGKRIGSYIFTYFLVTLLVAIACGCVYFMFNGGNLAAGMEKTTGTIVSTKRPVAVTDRVRSLGKEQYRLSYVQEIRVRYMVNGNEYQSSQQITYYSKVYDYEPSTVGVYPEPKFTTDEVLSIYVSPSNPNYFDLDNAFDVDGQTRIMSILKVAVPIYVVIMILFTISFVQKEKEAKKNAFYERMYMR